MGFFGNVFNKQPALPPLDPAMPASKNIEKFGSQLGSFAGKVKDRLEAVPTDETLYLFVGKPPGAFGIAWFEGDKEYSFKTLMEEKGLSPQRVQSLSDKLRDVYKRHSDEPRFSASLADHTITVNPSSSFADDVSSVIREVV